MGVIDNTNAPSWNSSWCWRSAHKYDINWWYGIRYYWHYYCRLLLLLLLDSGLGDKAHYAGKRFQVSVRLFLPTTLSHVWLVLLIVCWSTRWLIAILHLHTLSGWISGSWLAATILVRCWVPLYIETSSLMVHFFCHCSCIKMSENKACSCVPEGFDMESKYECVVKQLWHDIFTYWRRIVVAIECCCWTIACLVVIVSCGVTLVWLADCLTVFFRLSSLQERRQRLQGRKTWL